MNIRNKIGFLVFAGVVSLGSLFSLSGTVYGSGTVGITGYTGVRGVTGPGGFVTTVVTENGELEVVDLNGDGVITDDEIAASESRALEESSNVLSLRPQGQWRNLPTRVSDLADFVSVALHILLIIAAISFFIMLLVGGIRWILSGGDKANTQAARSQITAALVGLVIVFSAWIIAAIIGEIFNVNIFSINIPNI